MTNFILENRFMASFTLRLEDDQETKLKGIMDGLKRTTLLTTKTKAIHYVINTYSVVLSERDEYKLKYQQTLSKLRALEDLLTDKARIERKVSEYLEQH